MLRFALHPPRRPQLEPPFAETIKLMKVKQFTRCSAILAGCLASLVLTAKTAAEQVIFTEIQYNAEVGQPDFIEIANNTATVFDIANWYFSDGIVYTFPDYNGAASDAHLLQPFETILVSPVAGSALRTAHPDIPAEVRIFGPYTGALSNSGEKLVLNDKNGVVVTEIDYNDGGKWPAAADGTGHTLTRINPNLTNGEWRNWRASNKPGGTPGLPAEAPIPTALVISEIHFNADGKADWIELHAPGSSAVPVAGYLISPKKTLLEAASLSGSIPAGGYLSFDVDFTPDENGDLDLYLAKDGNVVDAVRLDRDHEEESFQSLPVGAEFYGGTGHTKDAPNNPIARQRNIVINEIMFDAPSDQGTGEYLELYNRGATAVDLSGWKISDGVRFDFPAGTTLPAGGYLVIASDLDCFSVGRGAVNAIGNWSGGLSDSGELIRIEDGNGNLVDEVDYKVAGDWPNLADGNGSSMELRHPDMDNNVGTAWADSHESDKSEMQTFTYTADFRRSTWLPLSSGQELHAFLVGDSHVILENISVTQDNAGANLVGKPNVMSPNTSSASGWVSQGTHWASFMDGGKLNLIADGHGDNKANRAEVDMTAPKVDESYTLSFDGRWVSGKSRVVFQTLDHGFGTSFLLPIPDDLGTPGAANSTLLPTAAPTVEDVIHRPAVPSPSDAVTVSARIDSAAALTSVELVHRLSTNDATNAWSRVTMTDDGTGLFSAAVSNNTSQGDITEFYVEAKSGAQSTFQPKYGAERPAMWVVDGRTMPAKLLRERFIVSRNDRRALNTSIGGGPTFNYNFPRMSNHFFNATFIANEDEIFYNAEIRKSGSPFTRATDANLDHGKWKLPKDRLFRNRRRSVIDASGTDQGSGTPRFYDDRIARYFLYQLGHPINEMEFVHSVINDDAFKIRENHEPISNDFLDRNFAGGSDGTLMRIDDEWRFTNDNGDSRSARDADWSYKNTDDPTAYQSEWILRSREADYDYGTFIEFTKALDERRTDSATLDRMANANMLALNAAVRGYDGDWDTLTVNRGKNAYLFRPKEGGLWGTGWMLIHWDGDRVFENTSQAILGGRTGVSTYFRAPHVRRLMNYYLTKLLDEHTKDSVRTQAWMQAEAAAVSGTGVTMTVSHYTNWFRNRESFARNFVTSAVNNANFAVTTSNAATTDNLFTLAGTAPPTVFNLRIVGHPETTVTWTEKTTWEIAGIALKKGTNTLKIQGLDHEGTVIEQLEFIIAKTDNSPPVINLVSTPGSLNLGLGEELIVDANGSYDPDGDDLVFSWKSTPESGATLVSGSNTVTATFSAPGFYILTATTSDSSLEIVTRDLGVSVYDEGNFSSFGGGELEGFWTPFMAQKHSNAPRFPYYNLLDHKNRLTINIPRSLASIALPEPEYPPAVNYVDFGAVWKYDDTNQELTGTFAQPDFDDSAWQSGPGFLGFGELGLPAPGLQTSTLSRDVSGGLVTYYFRTGFEFTGNPIGAQLRLSHIVDDGVRYYLNGQILGSVRLPEGDIDSNTPADRLEDEDVIEENILVLDVSGSIVQGANILAAEVHNQSAGSSDLVFGAKVDIASFPISDGPPNLDEATHPWVRRSLPGGDWTLQTEVKLEQEQFGEFFAGLLVQADQNGDSFRYGIGFKDGDSIAALRVNPSGTAESIKTVPALGADLAVVRLERKSDRLTFLWKSGDAFTEIHQVTLPPGTTFNVGGVFASTEKVQGLEASFDYAMLLNFSSDFTAWMTAKGFTDPDDQYQNTGMSNLLAYALGRDLNPDVAPVLISENGVIGFSHRQRLAGGQLSYRVERSDDLRTWEPAGDLTPVGPPVGNPDSTFTVNLLSNMPAVDRGEIYYRLKVGLQ